MKLVLIELFNLSKHNTYINYKDQKVFVFYAGNHSV